jgi:uncharacterized protein (DUF362 family)
LIRNSVNPNSAKPIVALVESKSHYNGVFEALKLVENQIEEGLKGKKKILIKPNFVSVSNQLAATHVDAVRAVLDMVGKYCSGKIVIGEGPAFGGIKNALVNFDFLKLQKQYNIKFLDLNEDDSVEINVTGAQQQPTKFNVSKTVVESDYRISVALPKTHDNVITTLTIKNIVVGSLIGRAYTHEKWKIHQEPKAMNLYLAALAMKVMPNLGVIDGFQGMEGRGPVGGDPVDLRVAAASVFPVSLDAVMSVVMGFDPLDIGYLYHLNDWGVGIADLCGIEIAGLPVEKVKRKFKPHPDFFEMLKWK